MLYGGPTRPSAEWSDSLCSLAGTPAICCAMATYQAECGVHENGGGRMAKGADHEGVPVPESGTREARVVGGAPRMTRTIVVLDVDRCARNRCSVVGARMATSTPAKLSAGGVQIDTSAVQ